MQEITRQERNHETLMHCTISRQMGLSAAVCLSLETVGKTLTVNETLSLLDTVQYCYDIGLSFFFWQDNGNCFFLSMRK